MNISKNFLSELKQEMASTKKILACVPSEKWNWRPHPKSMSLGDLAKHIVELTMWTGFIVKD